MSDLPAVGVGSVIAETYEVNRLLGQGGMGAVWEASHRRLPGKRVAIKVLLGAVADEASLARFRREAEIASRLGHPNIVEVLDFNSLPDGTPYMVLELLEGESLSQRLKRGPLELAEALDVVRQVGSALNAAHRSDVVHRDLKPDNIFLCPTDSGGVLGTRVKVLDFGISKIRNSNTVQTQESALLGTPQYMSPEQAYGKNRALDQRTDVWALGTIVLEMLTGRAAFSGETLAEVILKVVNEPAPSLRGVPGIPDHVAKAVERALSKSPEGRQPDVPTFVAEITGAPLLTLDRAAVAGPQTGPMAEVRLPATRHEAPAPAPSGRGLKVAGGALALLGVAAFGVGLWLRDGKAGTPGDGPRPGAIDPPPQAAPRPSAGPPERPVALPGPTPGDPTPGPRAGQPPPQAPAGPPAEGPDKPPAGRIAASRPTEATKPPKGEALAPEVQQELEAAEAALKAGDARQAFFRVQRAIRGKRTARGIALLTEVYCARHENSNALAYFKLVAAADRARVRRTCKTFDIELDL